MAEHADARALDGGMSGGRAPVVAPSTSKGGAVTLLDVKLNPTGPSLAFEANAWALGAVLALVVLALLLRRGLWRGLRSMEVVETELGIGSGKIKLRPNDTDLQVAYQIWVELSTRKIGLKIDLENDVIAEIYDSWHEFFGVTRELIKSVPVSRVTGDSTRKIVELSIDVLNIGLRPHLTHWQARFRGWYVDQLKRSEGADPQDLQKKFPKYAELTQELLEVNDRLIAYRAAMRRLVYGAGPSTLRGKGTT